MNSPPEKEKGGLAGVRRKATILYYVPVYISFLIGVYVFAIQPLPIGETVTLLAMIAAAWLSGMGFAKYNRMAFDLEVIASAEKEKGEGAM